ncbi:hypothetical protein CRG98_015551, partial [Punica granatum]
MYRDDHIRHLISTQARAQTKKGASDQLSVEECTSEAKLQSGAPGAGRQIARWNPPATAADETGQPWDVSATSATPISSRLTPPPLNLCLLYRKALEALLFTPVTSPFQRDPLGCAYFPEMLSRPQN